MTGLRGAKTRKGAAMIEFAVVLPILLIVVLGIIEFGRAIMVLDLVNNVARQGARAGSVPWRTNTDITAAVDTALSNSMLPSRSVGTVVTIKVNGNASTNAGAAVSDDQIAVTVAVTVSSTTWLPGAGLIGPATLLKGTVVMRRE